MSGQNSYILNPMKKIFLAISLALIYFIDQHLNSDDSKLILLIASFFWLCIAPLFLIFKINLKNFFLSSFVGWILVMPLIISLNDLIELGPWIVLLVLTTIWLADSSAYFLGSSLVKRNWHPLLAQVKLGKGF